MNDVATKTLDAPHWRLKRVLHWQALLALLLAAIFVVATAERMQISKLWPGGDSTSTETAPSPSQGGARVLDAMFPLAISETTPIHRIDDFDAAHLAPFARIETRDITVSALDPETLELETHVERQTVLVEPFGYLVFVIMKMGNTIEIAVWATFFAALLSIPLALLGARGYTPHRLVHGAARSLCAFLRAVPDIISALFFVLILGFGPLAGLIALALHGVGFLGKFYADDIENADKRPQEALRALGAGPLLTLRIGVLPQILPSLIGLTIYVLDRNIRMAAVIGLVGAGGIGLELKERFDLMHYDRVATIILVIFLTVLALDLATARLRARLMEGVRA